MLGEAGWKLEWHIGTVVYSLDQALQSVKVTRSFVVGPEKPKDKSRDNSLSPSGRPSAVSGADDGPTATRGRSRSGRIFFGHLDVRSRVRSLTDYGGRLWTQTELPAV